MTTSRTAAARTAALTAGLMLALPPAAQAGLFGISPIRLDLDRENKTSSFTVSNDDEERAIQMQAKLMTWTQDADGKDIYTESRDLVFFPQIFAIEKKEERVVKVGLKVPASGMEKAYRLFVEELPPPRDQAQPGGAQVKFVLRFGIPVFVRPEKEQASASIERVEARPGKVAVFLHNGGNQNFQIETLKLKAADGYATESVGGYVLAGVSKTVELELPLETCRKSQKLALSMKTDHLGLIERTLDLDTARCSAK